LKSEKGLLKRGRRSFRTYQKGRFQIVTAQGMEKQHHFGKRPSSPMGKRKGDLGKTKSLLELTGGKG